LAPGAPLLRHGPDRAGWDRAGRYTCVKDIRLPAWKKGKKKKVVAPGT